MGQKPPVIDIRIEVRYWVPSLIYTGKQPSTLLHRNSYRIGLIRFGYNPEHDITTSVIPLGGHIPRASLNRVDIQTDPTLHCPPLVISILYRCGFHPAEVVINLYLWVNRTRVDPINRSSTTTIACYTI